MESIKIQKYPAYKASGVDWLGEIPEHWEAVSLGSIMELKSDKNHPDYEVLSVYREYGVIKKDSRDDNHNATSLDTSNYKAVEPGDLVVNKMKAWQGSMGISAYKGIVSPAYITCKVNAEKIHPEYLHQLLRSNLYIGEYNRLSYGVRVGQWDMHYEDFKHITTTIPPKDEQITIASFLYNKTVHIESAIGIKEKQIELLKERRQILIHHAVTRGLNPIVKLKDSGVEWIGEIPEHWEILSFRHCIETLTDFTSNGSFASLASNVDYLSEGYSRLIRLTDLRVNLKNDGVFVTERAHNFLGNSELFGGELLIANVGAYAGFAEIMPTLNFKSTLGPNMLLLRLNQFNPYYAYLINSPLYSSYITNIATATAQPKLNKENIRNIRVIKPSIEEQKEIVIKIEAISLKFITAISLKEQEIEKLKEYKASLINSAVTGKIKIN